MQETPPASDPAANGISVVACVAGNATSGTLTIGNIVTPIVRPVNVQFGFFTPPNASFGGDNTTGIAEAFHTGESLTAVAQDVGGVWFIPAGTNTTTPGAVRGHARWPKLQAGFASEGALLLLYVTPVGLEQLSTVPDASMSCPRRPSTLARRWGAPP